MLLYSLGLKIVLPHAIQFRARMSPVFPASPTRIAHDDEPCSCWSLEPFHDEDDDGDDDTDVTDDDDDGDDDDDHYWWRRHSATSILAQCWKKFICLKLSK